MINWDLFFRYYFIFKQKQFIFYIIFIGLPANFNDENYSLPKTIDCIVSLLCERHGAIPIEAKVIKEYYMKNSMNKLFNEKILRGDQSNFSGILEALSFDSNNKAINKAYEQRVLSVGDFDERIFLGRVFIPLFYH